MVEAGGVNNGIPGTPTDSGDLFADDTDNADDSWQAVGSRPRAPTATAPSRISATGVWTYTLDNSNAAVQALNGAATLTDSFTALTADGTAQLVTVTIAAQNDAPVITGDAAGNVTEAGGVNNGTPGMPTDTGDLDSTDVDNPATAGRRCRPAPPPPAATAPTRCRRRGVDLHARRQQRRGAGAQRHRHADRQLHGADRGRHRAARHRHHRGAERRRR